MAEFMSLIRRCTRKLDLALAAAIFAAVIVAVYIRLYFAIDFTDESFYVALPYSFTLGHEPMIDEISIHQFAGLLIQPFVEGYLAIVGSQYGLVLFVRHLYFGYALVCALLVATCLGRIAGRPAGMLLGACSMAYVPFHIPSLSYNTMMSLGLLGGSLALALALQSRRPGTWSFTGTLMLASATLSYPPIFIVTGPLVAAGAIGLARAHGGRRLAAVLLPIVLAGALALTWCAWVFLSFGGFAGVERILALNDAIAAQGGGAVKLTQLSRELNHLLPLLGGLLVATLLVHGIARFAPNRGVGLAALTPLLVVVALALPTEIRLTLPGTISPLMLSLFALTSMLGLWTLQGIDGARHRPALATISVASIAAGVLILWATANGLRNGTLGFMPAALVGLALLCRAFLQWQPAGGLPSILPVFVLLIPLVGFQIHGLYSRPYRDAPTSELTRRVPAGAYAGIRSGEERVKYIADLQRNVERYAGDSQTVLFYNYFPAGYLVTQLQPNTSALWMFPLTGRRKNQQRLRLLYAEHFESEQNRPDLVIRMKWIPIPDMKRSRVYKSDPVRLAVESEDYEVVWEQREYAILRRRGIAARTAPALSQLGPSAAELPENPLAREEPRRSMPLRSVEGNR